MGKGDSPKPRYGGTQQGNERIVIDENGNQQIVRDDIEVSPLSDHEPAIKELAKRSWVYAAPLGAYGLETLAGPVGGSIAGSTMGSVPGYAAPAAESALPTSLLPVSETVGPAAIGSGGGLPSTLLPGVTPAVGPANIGSGSPGWWSQAGRLARSPMGKEAIKLGTGAATSRLLGGGSRTGGQDFDFGPNGPLPDLNRSRDIGYNRALDSINRASQRFGPAPFGMPIPGALGTPREILPESLGPQVVDNPDLPNAQPRRGAFTRRYS